jgi:hypothetical protein
MTEPVRIFIDDQGVSVAPGTTMLAAVAGHDPARAERIQSGVAYLTDGRGIRLDAGAAVYQGAIVRIVISARASREESDAHP